MQCFSIRCHTLLILYGRLFLWYRHSCHVKCIFVSRKSPFAPSPKDPGKLAQSRTCSLSGTSTGAPCSRNGQDFTMGLLAHIWCRLLRECESGCESMTRRKDSVRAWCVWRPLRVTWPSPATYRGLVNISQWIFRGKPWDFVHHITITIQFRLILHLEESSINHSNLNITPALFHESFKTFFVPCGQSRRHLPSEKAVKDTFWTYLLLQNSLQEENLI